MFRLLFYFYTILNLSCSLEFLKAKIFNVPIRKLPMDYRFIEAFLSHKLLSANNSLRDSVAIMWAHRCVCILS